MITVLQHGKSLMFPITLEGTFALIFCDMRRIFFVLQGQDLQDQVAETKDLIVALEQLSAAQV